MILLVVLIFRVFGTTSRGTQTPSLVVSFNRYGTAMIYSNRACAFLSVSNSGPPLVQVCGMAAAEEVVIKNGSKQTYWHGLGHGSQIVMVKKGEEWAQDEWPSFPSSFKLRPGETQEVTLILGTNAVWSAFFTARTRGLIDSSPGWLKKILPARMRRIPQDVVFQTDSPANSSK